MGTVARGIEDVAIGISEVETVDRGWEGIGVEYWRELSPDAQPGGAYARAAGELPFSPPGPFSG